MEQRDEPSEASLDQDLIHGVCFLETGLGPGVGMVVDLDSDDASLLGPLFAG